MHILSTHRLWAMTAIILLIMTSELRADNEAILANAAPTSQCELHIFPNNVIDTDIHMPGENYGLVGALIDSLHHPESGDEAIKLAGTYLDINYQESAINSFDITNKLNLAKYKILFDNTQKLPQSQSNKDIDLFFKELPSKYNCYAELRITGNVYGHQNYRKYLYTFFSYREFNEYGLLIKYYRDGTGSRLKYFPPTSKEDDNSAKLEMQSGFLSNLD